MSWEMCDIGRGPGGPLGGPFPMDFVAAEDPDQASLSNEERLERWRKNREIRDLELGFLVW